MMIDVVVVSYPILELCYHVKFITTLGSYLLPSAIEVSALSLAF